MQVSSSGTMPLQPCTVLAVKDIAHLALAAFAQACQERLDAGERLLTLFARPDPDQGPLGLVTTAVFQALHSPLEVVRGRALRGDRYPSLTTSHPAAQIHERELWEQCGLVPEGHPWLKPVRFEGERQQQMQDYPFFKVRGQQVHEVGVGPIHASVIEPGHFRFMCLGESVHHLEIQLGYQHRHVEALLLRRLPTVLTPLVESICGDSAVAYAWGHCAAIEALSGQPVPLETEMSRAVGLEMERIAMHLATLNGLATDIAFLQGTGTYGRLRTALINASQRVCGNRFGRGWMRPGRASPLTPALRSDLHKTLSDFARDVDGINSLMLRARSVRARMRGVGSVSTRAAQELGTVGLMARACGIADDARTRMPGAAFAHAPITALIETDGDCWARMVLRMREIDASVRWLQGVLNDASLDLAATAVPTVPPLPLQPDALCVSQVEGPRGPVVQVLETSHAGALLHYKVQDPSLANWFALAMALRNNAISDFPICNKSFDLSYCGNDL
jgi:Ni,Fe-hydrogenase III large subunit